MLSPYHVGVYINTARITFNSYGVKSTPIFFQVPIYITIGVLINYSLDIKHIKLMICLYQMLNF